jgi:hypothetical protein
MGTLLLKKFSDRLILEFGCTFSTQMLNKRIYRKGKTIGCLTIPAPPIRLKSVVPIGFITYKLAT